jgi:Reverse transcriptase (RNA-dependent DNA polymerase)
LDTWEIVDLPPGERTVGSKWVFDIKYTPTGLVDRYKARLVAQGFSQVLGDDYLETFSPTIRVESLRLLLAIGAYLDLEIRQLDVVNVYPRSDLYATVYIRLPEGLECPKGKTLLVKKSLYSLKQSGREWYIEASRGLESLGLTPCFSELCIFTSSDRSLIVGLYVDDMLILGADLQAVQSLVKGIASL